jgi:hypothetical protein
MRSHSSLAARRQLLHRSAQLNKATGYPFASVRLIARIRQMQPWSSVNRGSASSNDLAGNPDCMLAASNTGSPVTIGQADIAIHAMYFAPAIVADGGATQHGTTARGSLPTEGAPSKPARA